MICGNLSLKHLSGGARNLPEEGCAMDPEDTLADKLTEEELKAIADMNQLLGIGYVDFIQPRVI